MLWNEAVAGRTAANVACTYLKMLKLVDTVPNVVIWADNCGGQNKNWFLLTALVLCVNSWGPESVTLKFLEKEHTFMAADNVMQQSESDYARNESSPLRISKICAIVQPKILRW